MRRLILFSATVAILGAALFLLGGSVSAGGAFVVHFRADGGTACQISGGITGTGDGTLVLKDGDVLHISCRGTFAEDPPSRVSRVTFPGPTPTTTCDLVFKPNGTFHYICHK